VLKVFLLQELQKRFLIVNLEVLYISIPNFNSLAVPIVDGDGDVHQVSDNMWNKAEHKEMVNHQ
jgi:hypothetical protein